MQIVDLQFFFFFLKKETIIKDQKKKKLSVPKNVLKKHGEELKFNGLSFHKQF